MAVKCSRCVSALFGVATLAILLLPSQSQASLLYLDPTGGSYQKGSTFVVTVRLDPEGECVNAVNAVVTYPKDEITVFDVSQSRSILSLWVEPPRIDQVNGQIHFQGGIPNGYCGRIDGDPGNTNVIGEIIFRKQGGLSVGGGSGVSDIRVDFNEDVSEVLRNDGRGTPADLTFQGGVYRIDPNAPLIDESAWFDVLRNDRIPPESFTVTLASKSDIKNGRYFVVFSTTDKQSGIDSYEIMEESRNNPGMNEWKKNTPAIWERASSPYVLKDQTLNSIIRIKAIDKAGNERISVYVPNDSERSIPKEQSVTGVLYAGIVGIIVIIGGVLFISKVRRKKLPPLREEVEGDVHNQP